MVMFVLELILFVNYKLMEVLLGVTVMSSLVRKKVFPNRARMRKTRSLS